MEIDNKKYDFSNLNKFENFVTVSEISNKIKFLVEGNLSSVKIKGEIGNCTIHSSGHIYFNIKDDGACIDCICWKSVAANHDVSIFKQGMEVMLTGKITTYPQRSRYQIVITSATIGGEGNLLQRLQATKKLLLEDGVFSKIHKHNLPFLPSKIGIITSITGAVLHDILHRINDRFPTSIVVFPSRMQGEGSAKEVIKGIECFSKYNVDLIIIARGGGSVEDLWEFNNPDLARKVSKCATPIISAIGHETDTTLIDYAACVRAPTPSAAAEIAVPVKSELLFNLNNKMENIRKRLSMALLSKQDKLYAFKRLTINLPEKIEYKQHHLDDQYTNLNSKLRKCVYINEIKFSTIYKSIINTFNQSFDDFQTIIDNCFKLLKSYSHINVIQRGYALIKQKNNILKSIKQFKRDESITIVLKDGEVEAKIDNN